MLRRSALLSLLCGGLLLLNGLADPARVLAQDEPAAAVSELPEPAETAAESTSEDAETPKVDQLAYAVDNITLFICAVLVLFMQAGFAMVESGFNASKNTVNILFKNVMDLSIGVLLFWAVGYSLMYPGGEYAGGYFGFGGIGISSEYDSSAALHPQVDWLFQVAFAATAATIVSGAVAGRMKFASYLIYSAIITGLVYPVSGMWRWGGGWLATAEFQFHDFAGSTIVHAVGGFAGLAGAIVLGPRLGRYSADGRPQPMPGHNMTFAALGVFILWIGWYGFNPGSQLAFSSISDTSVMMTVAANTTLAAGAGGFGAMLLGWLLFKKPDLSLTLNGVLAGLVGITANCDCVTNPEAMIIGGAAGVLVVLGIIALDKLRIDDPVGAFPVHGLCGVWGGLATGIFGEGKNLMIQLKGTAAICGWAFVTMLVLFLILKAAGILRVSPEEESQGLDIGEHGMHAYTA